MSDNDKSFWLGFVAAAIIGFVLLGFFAVLLAFDEDFTCEEWGTSPVVIDGDKVCLPWEDVLELDVPQP